MTFANFNIYRDVDPILGDVSSLTLIDQALVNVSATTFLDTTVDNGVQYYYAVTAEYASGFEDTLNVEPTGPVVYFVAFDIVGDILNIAQKSVTESPPDIVYNELANEYLILFERDTNGDGSNFDVSGQLVTADGTKVGGAIPIAISDLRERRPSPTYNPVPNEFLIMYEYEIFGDGINYIVKGQAINADGGLIGSIFWIGGMMTTGFPLDPRASFGSSKYKETCISGDITRLR